MGDTGEEPSRDFYGKNQAVGDRRENDKNILSKVTKPIPRGPCLQWGVGGWKWK